MWLKKTLTCYTTKLNKQFYSGMPKVDNGEWLRENFQYFTLNLNHMPLTASQRSLTNSYLRTHPTQVALFPHQVCSQGSITSYLNQIIPEWSYPSSSICICMCKTALFSPEATVSKSTAYLDWIGVNCRLTMTTCWERVLLFSLYALVCLYWFYVFHMVK